MPYIKVNSTKLSSFQETLNSIQSRVNRIKNEYSSIGNSLDWDVKSKSNISRKVNIIQNELSVEKRSLEKMAIFFSNAKREYGYLEEKKINIVLSSSTPNSISASSTTTKNSAIKTVGKVVGKMGFVGTAISGLINFASSGNATIGAKTVVDVAKSGKDVIKGLLDWRKAARNKEIYSRLQPGKAKVASGKFWKSAFGLNDIYKGKASKFKSSWSKRFTRNFSKRMDSQVGGYKKGGATSAFAWIGLGLNFAGNAISNYQEYQNDGISKHRAIAETITETAVDTATGWVIGAGVAAGLAATIGSAPVLVVGAATVGITMGLDYACKKITGAITGTEKGLTETVSDLVLDVGEAVVNKGKQIVSGVADFISDPVGSIKKSKVGKFFGKLFG